jgi:hypothetical protein
LASASLSGNVTPQSASMELETPTISGHVETGAKTPAGNAVKQFSFPPPYARDNNDNGKDKVKQLLKNLSSFAQVVTETASSTVRLDLVQSRFIKSEKEAKKWQSHYGDYTSLADEQAKAVKTLKDVADRVDERLLKFKQAQDDAIKTLAATILSVNSTTTIPAGRQDDSKVKLLEAEVKELKAGLKSLNSSFEALKIAQAQPKPNKAATSQQNPDFQDIIIDPENLRNQLGQIRSFQAGLTRGDRRIASLEYEFKNLADTQATVAQIREVQEQIAGFQERLDSTKVTNEDLSALQAEVNSLTQSVQILNEEVIGTYKNGSGKDDHKSRITRLQEDIGDVNRELNAQVENLNSHGDRLASLVATNNTTVSGRLDTSTTEVTQIAKDLSAVVNDQKIKDELVAQEVDRLDQSISAVQNELVKMRADLSETRTNLQRQGTTSNSEKTLTNGTYPLQSQQPSFNRTAPQDGAATANPLDSQTNLLTDYNDRLIVCETVLTSLQHRFDNLSTADLARNMVHQMSTMYPYPAQVLAQVEQLGRNYNTLVQSVTSLSGNYSMLSRRVDAIAQNSAPNTLLTVYEERIKSLEARFAALPQRSATPGNPAELASKAEVDEITASLGGQLAALKADIATSKADLQENSLGLKDINEVLDLAKDQYQSTVSSLKSEVQEIWEALKQKLSITEQDKFKVLVQAYIAKVDKVLEEKAEVTSKEIGDMHEEVTRVMKHLKMPYRGESQESDSEDSRNGILNKPVATSASPAITLGQSDNTSEEDSDPVRRPSLGRSMLTRKKGHKRKRHSKASESESNPTRKMKMGQ